MSRTPGSPNKRFTFSVHDELKRRGVNIVGEIWKRIEALEDSPSEQIRYMLQLLEYVDAKRKAVEVTISPETEAEFESIPVSLLTQYVNSKREDEGGQVQILS